MEEIPEEKIIAPIAPSSESGFPVRTPDHNNINDHLHKHNTHRDVDPENLVATISTQSHVSPPSSRIQEIFFIFVICMAQWFTLSGLSLSVVTGHIIGESFPNTTPGLLSWFAAAYSLTVGTFILVAGRLGDLYGHKLMFIIGFSWMGLWSLLAGFSVWSNAIFFCVCRAFQGVGAGLLLPNAIAIFGRTYPPGRMKELVFSLFGAAAPGGSIVGGVFAALISERAWWPWSYWVMGIVCFCFAFLGLLAIPHTPSPRLTDNLSFVTRIDIFGAFFGISGLVLINFAWNQAPIVGWQDPYTYVLLIVGFLSLGAFALVERKATCPLLPTSVFTGDVAWALSCIAAGWSSFGIAMYYWYQIMEVLENNSPLLTVAKWSAAPVMGIVAGLTTAYLLSRVSPSVIMVIALSAFVAGSCLMATMPTNQTYWAQGFVLSIIYPFGMDMSFPAATILISNAMPRCDQGLAASLVTTLVNYSMSMGLGFAGTVETHVNNNGQDLLRGYRGALYVSIGLAGLGMLISLLYMLVSWRRHRAEPSSTDVSKENGEPASSSGSELK